jgi:hypothetical protein
MRSLKETILKLQTGGFNKEKRCQVFDVPAPWPHFH